MEWPFGSAHFILVKVQFPEWSLLLDIRYKSHYGSGIGIVKLLPRCSALPSGHHDTDSAEYAELDPGVSIWAMTLS